MYKAEESHIRKLLEEVLDEESNVEVGYESDLWSDHQSDSDHNSESEDDADPENISDSTAGIRWAIWWKEMEPQNGAQ